MALYIQLRDEIVDEEQVRQMWIKADSIEVAYDGVTYLDPETGEWLWLDRVGKHDDVQWRCHDDDQWRFLGKEEFAADIMPFDFMFIRDRLLQNCKLGYTNKEGVVENIT